MEFGTDNGINSSQSFVQYLISRGDKSGRDKNMSAGF